MYSEIVRMLAQSGKHAGPLEGATHCGTGGEPGCGPYMVLSFRVEGGVVEAAAYRTYGCPVAMACGEVACARSEGEPLQSLAGVTAAHVTRWVGGVPEGKEHCPELASEAMRRAVGCRV